MIAGGDEVAVRDCRERGSDVADGKSTTRRRAVGTRERVLSHLSSVGEVRDGDGMASTMLAGAVGYPGSSIAFAQLLSGMERSGLIKREVRGKRTYRISLGPARARAGRSRPGSRGPMESAGPARPQRPAQAPRALRGDRPARTGAGGGQDLADARGGDFDYDELARRLLIQVVQRLAASPVPGPEPVPELALSAEPGQALGETVASLERKLASVQTRQRTLSEENAKLREQLHEAQRSLALVQERAGRPRITEQLNAAEGDLLERLLLLAKEKRGQGEAETG
jgi:hypothetical protein